MKYKNIIYSFLISIILLIIPFNIYAQTSINLIANKTDLEPGDEIILTAKTNEELELYALMATLSYAPNVFEEIETTSFTALNDTTEINYNAKTNKFGIINKIGTINNEIFQIKLKVKENPDVGETNIALTNISASDGETKEILSAASLTLLVTRDALEGETLPTNEPNEIMETQETILKTFTNKPILIETGIALGLTLIGL